MRRARLVAVVALAAAGSCSCALSDEPAATTRLGTVPVPAALSASMDERGRHVLQRVTYGPRPRDAEQVKAIGFAAWLERQLDPDRIDDAVT